jgi:hypothetical protein
MTHVHAASLVPIQSEKERGSAPRNGRAGPLRGINCPKSGVRRGTTDDRLNRTVSQPPTIRCAPLLSRRLVRRSSDGSLSLTAHFLTAAAGTVKPQISRMAGHEMIFGSLDGSVATGRSAGKT